MATHRLNRLGLPWIDEGDVIVASGSVALVLKAKDGLPKRWVWIDTGQVVDKPFLGDGLQEAMVAQRVILKQDGTVIPGPEKMRYCVTYPDRRAWIDTEGWLR